MALELLLNGLECETQGGEGWREATAEEGRELLRGLLVLSLLSLLVQKYKYDAQYGATVQILTQKLRAGVAGASAHAGAAGEARGPHQVLAYSMPKLVAQVLVCQNSWPSPGTSMRAKLVALTRY